MGIPDMDTLVLTLGTLQRIIASSLTCGNSSVVYQIIGAYAQQVDQPLVLKAASRRAIDSTELGQVTLVEVIIKPTPTPETPDDWTR